MASLKGAGSGNCMLGGRDQKCMQKTTADSASEIQEHSQRHFQQCMLHCLIRQGTMRTYL